MARKRSQDLGGRPPLPKGEALSVAVLVRLRQADGEALQAWADEIDSTPAAIARGLIEHALARRR